MAQFLEDSNGDISNPSEDCERGRLDNVVQYDLPITSALEGLQTNEQRRVLDTVAQIRKCGLESILSLPQLVVCGDQSAGKSSVLEALTEIPFPRNDNLCTRFATEIILRRAATDSLTIRVIPDNERPANEIQQINAFKESILDFDDLPELMEKAMIVMGLEGSSTSNVNKRAFARDVLSIEIEGPTRPQLTLVDLPGLIQTKTKGVSELDVKLVAEITNHYISQPRTICLAVTSATNDYANQGILTKVRNVDPEGERTLGVITKPDRLSSGSGSEKAFLSLARNEDIFFKLGWHVLKNRSYEEGSSSFTERNMSEMAFFRQSNFNTLPKDSVGIESLSVRLSGLLYDHVKQELPKLRADLEMALTESKGQLKVMGIGRTTPQDCKEYLTRLSLEYYELCKAAVNGHYEGDYFTYDPTEDFALSSKSTIRRLRAVIQIMNSQFANSIRLRGHKYYIDRKGGKKMDDKETHPRKAQPSGTFGIAEITRSLSPTTLNEAQAHEWICQLLLMTRGKELSGDFNPLIVGELFWEQSANWRQFAEEHVNLVAQVCSLFLQNLLEEKSPKDIQIRLLSQIQESLRHRNEAAIREINLIMEDVHSYPINYNHYYTDTKAKQRRSRESTALTQSFEEAAGTGSKMDEDFVERHYDIVNVQKAIQNYQQQVDPDMDRYSCDEALDSLLSIYKVSLKTFIANITTQVVERHVVRGLEQIFSPIVVNRMTDAEAQDLASEPKSATRQREFLEDRIKKLEDGRRILKGVTTL